MADNENYAIVETGGKQYRAERGKTILVERLSDAEGAKVSLRPLMFSGDKAVVASGPDLEKVKVEAVVAEHLRGPKVRIFKHRPKKGYRKRAGHRQALTRLEVTEITLLARKPAAKAEAKPKAEPQPVAAAKRPAAKSKPAARKPAAKKPAAKKPAAKKPAAKKPAARKPAAKKPATKKPAARKPATKKPATKKPAVRKPATKKES
ncbi:MAG: 50S ribosomal protein L21 [bacterium]